MRSPTEPVPLKARYDVWHTIQPTWALPLIVMGVALILWASINGFMKSRSEFKAIAWHLRHGDRISVGGVTFPVYIWYAPKQYPNEFSVDDEPGPVRSFFSRAGRAVTFFSIAAYKDEKDVGTPPELVETRIRDFEKAGYHGLSKFQMNIRSQIMDCMQRHDDRFSGTVIYCYGEGPFYSVFFAGSDHALNRFRQMISDAR